MDEHEIADALREVLEAAEEITDEGLADLPDVARVDTFEDAGVLTRNVGLVLRLEDGSEFQITVVRSR